MVNKVLLLDIDGVLVRDRALLGHVRDKCVRYVKNKLPYAKNPGQINDVMYLSHGHTATGLKTIYGINTDDFNSYVYDKNVMSHLTEVVYGSEFQREAKEIHSLIETGTSVTLFTNAPHVWAKTVARAMSDNICIANNEYMKPNEHAYVHFPVSNDYLFVDDNLKNLGAVRRMNNWQPLYYGVDDVEWCPTVRSIHEVCQIVQNCLQGREAP